MRSQFALQFVVALCVIALCIVILACSASPVDAPAMLPRDSYYASCPPGKAIDQGSSCLVGDVFNNAAGKVVIQCPADYPTFTFSGCKAANGNVFKVSCPAGYVSSTNRCYKQCPDGYNNKGTLCVNGDFKLSPPTCNAEDEMKDDKCYKPCPSGMIAYKADNKLCVSMS